MGGEQTKEKYRQYFDVFCDRPVHSQQHNFWSFFFTGWKDSEVYELVSAEDIRILRKKQPGNLSTLIFKCIEQIVLYCNTTDHSDQISCRNSVMYLTRILPILFEGDADNFIESLFENNLIKTRPKSERPAIETGAPEEPKSPFFPFNPDDEKEFAEKLETFSPAPKTQKKERSKDPERDQVAEEVRKMFANVAQRADLSPDGDSLWKKPRGENLWKRKKKKKILFERVKVDDEDFDAGDPNAKSGEEKILFSKTDLEKNNSGSHKKKKKKKRKKKRKPNAQVPKKTIVPPRRGVYAIIANQSLEIPLFKKLVFTLYHALFLPDFTIPKAQFQPKFKRSVDMVESVDPNLLWEGGVLIPRGKFYPTTEHLANRKHILRCLMACATQCLYRPQNEIVSRRDVFVEMLLSPNAPYTSNLFFSLLNVVGAYNPSGSLPYTSILFRDNTEEITLIAIQFLALVLCADNENNVYHKYVASIKNPKDVKYITSWFARLFGNLVDADNTYLPNSQKRIAFTEELFVVFWKFLEHNHLFRYQLCRDDDVLKITTTCLYMFQKHAKDEVQFPFLQVIAFSVLLLSEERQFGVTMNKPYAEKLPVKLPLFRGNYLDFLIVLLYQVIITDKEKIIKPLLNCLFTIIHNVSPYAKTLSITASVKLLSLFEILTHSRVLFGNATNFDLLFLMLNTLNNIVQYQYDGNHNVVYSILRKKEYFEKLTRPVNVEKVKEVLRKKKIKFKPTREWIDQWKPRLPLRPIVTLVRALVPEVEQFCMGGSATEEDVINYLKKTTLVGILPVPHNIVIRTFKSNDRISIFLTTFVWGLIYVKGLSYIPHDTVQYDARKIRLFSVKSKE